MERKGEKEEKGERVFLPPVPAPPASLFLSEIRVSPRAREEREGVGLEESVERGFTNAQTKQDGCNDSGISS